VTERSGASQRVTPPMHRCIRVRIASFGYVMRTKKRTDWGSVHEAFLKQLPRPSLGALLELKRLSHTWAGPAAVFFTLASRSLRKIFG
jgi:hypothetical protein